MRTQENTLRITKLSNGISRVGGTGVFGKVRKKVPSLVAQTTGRECACDAGDLGSILESGRSPGEGNGNPLQYSCLENPMGRGAWWATVYRVAKSWTWLKWQHWQLLNTFEKGGQVKKQSSTWTGPFSKTASLSQNENWEQFPDASTKSAAPALETLQLHLQSRKVTHPSS